MLIFIYTTLILVAGLANKLFQSFSGQYGPGNLITDLPLVILTYFGLIALLGRAKRKRYFSESFWRAYFVLLMASVILVPILDPTIQSMTREFGVPMALGAYGVMVILLLPYYWGVYSYAYGKSCVWAST